MSQAIAQTILEQLGGRRFTVMTGARSLCSDARALSFRLSAAMTRHRATGMRIELNERDLYDISLFKVVKFEVETVDRRNDVHAEDLRSVFTDMTGLDTSLGRAA